MVAASGGCGGAVEDAEERVRDVELVESWSERAWAEKWWWSVLKGLVLGLTWCVLNAREA